MKTKKEFLIVSLQEFASTSNKDLDTNQIIGALSYYLKELKIIAKKERKEQYGL